LTNRNHAAKMQTLVDSHVHTKRKPCPNPAGLFALEPPMNNATIRRQLGGLPTGPYRLAEQQSSIRHVETELKPEDHEEGVWVAVQELQAFTEREQ
jgi:hypothetical protein